MLGKYIPPHLEWQHHNYLKMNHFLLLADNFPVQKGHSYKLECNALLKSLTKWPEEQAQKTWMENCTPTAEAS